jgi:predicted alpha-1,6-mannanase (GH76 family)
MWKVRCISLSFVCALLCLFLTSNANAVTQATLKTWGTESMTQLRTDFRLSTGLYAQSLTERFPSYAWGQGVMLSTFAQAAKGNSSYLAEAEAVANLMHTNFWCTSGGYSAYNAASGSCGDRYTDDNAWIALALLELHDITNNSTYLTRARDAITFIMAFENGPSNIPTGGIRWHETTVNGAAVCSTVPACLANLIIYQKTGITSYLTNGQRLFNWLITSGVQDPAHGLYTQGVNVDGTINYGWLGYQTAVPLQASVRLYQITGNAWYLAEAQRLASEMEAEFLTASTHAFEQQGYWGGHDMTNALVELYETDGNQHWLDVAGGYLQYLHDNCKFSGRYPDVWNNISGATSAELLANASVARAYWKLASTAGGSAPACASIPIMPFFTVNSGSWQQTIKTTMAVGDSITVGPQPADGTWSWTGPNGFTASTREITISNIQISQAGIYYATYTNPCGMKAYCPFTISIPACALIPIMPYLYVNGGAWQQTPSATLAIGNSITMGPQPGDGTWSWTGPNGFTAGTREITISNIQTAQAGNYIARYTNPCGTSAYCTFTIKLPACALIPVVPYLSVNGGAWQQVASASLAAGGSIAMGPQPADGTWSWSGPNGFTASSREITISNIQTTQAGNYNATYTNPCGTNAYCTFTITVTGSVTTLLQDGFESNFDKWTDGGATDWDRATDQKHAGSYAARATSVDNDLISDNLNTTGKSSITIEFWYRDDDIDNDDDIYLQLYNGSAYANKFELGNSTEDTWIFYTTTIYNSGTDTQYFRSNFRIKYEGTSIDSGENLWIDDVKITAQ